MVDESYSAAVSSLSSLCELAGKLSVRLGVVLTSSTQLGYVIVTHIVHVYCSLLNVFRCFTFIASSVVSVDNDWVGQEAKC